MMLWKLVTRQPQEMNHDKKAFVPENRMKIVTHGLARMMRIRNATIAGIALALGVSEALSAQPVIGRIFAASEFAARRAAVMQKIGDGVAILQGTTERPGEQPLRQNNAFYYLTGVIEPRAMLVIDGRSKRSTLFLSPTNERREQSMFGPSLTPGDSAEKDTGIESVVARDEFGTVLSGVGHDGRVIFTPSRAEVLGSASSGDPVALARATKNDPWDGRESREEAFRAKIRTVAPTSEIKDLDPILDSLRSIKSLREIEVIREATRIAGFGIMEAMRDAQPGMYEYELQADAEFVFKKHGSYGPAYFALIATGKNTYYTHYHKEADIERLMAQPGLSKGFLSTFQNAPHD